MSSPKLTMDNFIAKENQIFSDRDAAIKALKEEEKKVFDEGRKKFGSLIEEAKESGLFKMRLGDYFEELERVAGVLPGTLVVHIDMLEKIDGDIRKTAAARVFDNAAGGGKDKQLKVMLFCNHPGRGFVTGFTVPFTLLNNDFADGSKFRDNLHITVVEEGGLPVSYVAMNEANQANLVADLSSIMEPGMMSDCRTALISAIKKKEQQKQKEERAR